jgi:hypothetical protein
MSQLFLCAVALADHGEPRQAPNSSAAWTSLFDIVFRLQVHTLIDAV